MNVPHRVDFVNNLIGNKTCVSIPVEYWEDWCIFKASKALHGYTTLTLTEFRQFIREYKLELIIGYPDLHSSNNDPFEQSSLETLREGNIVKHRNFGVGVVLKVYKRNANNVAEINFRAAGQKTLLLTWAQLEIIR